jgi:hypothetical protein
MGCIYIMGNPEQTGDRFAPPKIYVILLINLLISIKLYYKLRIRKAIAHSTKNLQSPFPHPLFRELNTMMTQSQNSQQYLKSDGLDTPTVNLSSQKSSPNREPIKHTPN